MTYYKTSFIVRFWKNSTNKIHNIIFLKSEQEKDLLMLFRPKTHNTHKEGFL